MKKSLIKLCAIILLISSVSFVLHSKNNIEAAVNDKIFATPTQAAQKGLTFTTTATATRSELNKLSDILDYDNKVTSFHYGVLVTIVTAPLAKKLSIPVGIASGLISSYAETTKAKIVTNALKKSSKSTFKVNITYKYKQLGSGQGYYYISNITIN